MARRLLVGLGSFLLAALAILAILCYWYRHRPHPPAVDKDLFVGVHYVRSIRSVPRPLVLHIVTIQLDAPGLGFLVTPGDPAKPRPLAGKLTTRFVRENSLQLAINGDYFAPWHSTAPWDYYPHVGDPVESGGPAASRGVVYFRAPRKVRTPMLVIGKDNAARIAVKLDPPIYNVVSGGPTLVRRGTAVHYKSASNELGPRTSAGISADRKRLILLLVDGRQPNYSEGVTLGELADLLVEVGAYEALNLDGGGSTTLSIQGKDGEPEILNCPIDNHIPGRERPVANHLGVFARPLSRSAGPDPRIRPSDR